MMTYLRWLRGQWLWWIILVSQALGVVLSEETFWAALVLLWVLLASLWNFSSDQYRDTVEVWRGLYDSERKLSEGYEKLYNETRDMLLAERRRL